MDVGEVPRRPDPPVLGKATHHSVELNWHPPPHQAEHSRLRYCVQEEDASKKDGFGTVYKYDNVRGSLRINNNIMLTIL